MRFTDHLRVEWLVSEWTSDLREWPFDADRGWGGWGVGVEPRRAVIFFQNWIELNTFIFSDIRVHWVINIHPCVNNYWATLKWGDFFPCLSQTFLINFIKRHFSWKIIIEFWFIKYELEESWKFSYVLDGFGFLLRTRRRSSFNFCSVTDQIFLTPTPLHQY